MSKRRRSYEPSYINPQGFRIAFNRDVQGDIAANITNVSKFIATLGIPGLSVLPKSEMTKVTILHNETVRRYFMQRQNSKRVLDTADLEDLAYKFHLEHGDAIPTIPVYDTTAPFRVDEDDTLVIDLANSNELQIDRCRILQAISDAVGSKTLSPEDIDTLIDPELPILPIATIDKRLMGSAYDDFAMDPTGFMHEEILFDSSIDTTPLSMIPDVIQLGKLSIQPVSKRKPLSPMPEYFPDIEFDGVKKKSYA
jgi:hypothetical protein